MNFFGIILTVGELFRHHFHLKFIDPERLLIAIDNEGFD